VTFGGLLYRPPFTDETPFTDEGLIWCAIIADPYAYVPNFVSIALLCRPLFAKIFNFCRFFVLRHLVLSPVGGSLRKLNTSAQVQTSPFQRHQIVSVLQRFDGEIGRTISDVQKRDEQTDEQTDKQTKTQRFWPPRRRVKSDPTKLGMVIEYLEHVLAPLKLLEI